MSDLSWTAANVRSIGGVIETLAAGGTVARGNLIRKNSSNQAVVASDNSAVNAAAYGLALNDAAVNQPVTVHVLARGGEVEGATFGVGKAYQVSTDGATCPVDDTGEGDFVHVIGVGVSATRLKTGSIDGGVAAAAAVS